MANSYANARIIDWAISASGFNDDSVAKRLNVSEEKLAEIRHGVEPLSVGQLEKLRIYLKRPSSTFYLPQPPQDIEEVVLRRAPGDSTSSRPPAERYGIRLSKVIQREFERTIHETGRNVELLPQFSSNNSAEEAADEVRKWLELPDSVEASPSKTFRARRRSVEQLGIFVLLHSMGKAAARGFSLSDSIAPVIGINTHTWNPGVRSYTLMHELGHVLTRTSSSCSSVWEHASEKNEAIERWCESFAASVLMPTKRVLDEISDKSNYKALRLAVRISNKFHVSVQAAFIRLVHVKRVSWDDYNEQYQPDRDVSKGGGGGANAEPRTREVNARDMLGEAAIRLLSEGIRNGTTTSTDLLRTVGVDDVVVNSLARDLGTTPARKTTTDRA